MKKICREGLVLFVSVISLWFATSFFIGWKIKTQFCDFLETANQGTPFTLKLVNYKRGISRSNATIEVSLDKWLSNNKIKWILHADFIHGPIVLDKIKINFVQTLADLTLVYLGEHRELTPKVRAELKLSFGGRFKFRLKNSKLFSLTPNKYLIFSGESNLKNLVLDWYLPKLTIENRFYFKHGHLSVRGDYQPLSRLWFGSHQLQLEYLEVEDAGKKWLGKGILLETELGKEAMNFSLHLKGEAKDLTYNRYHFEDNRIDLTLDTPQSDLFNQIGSLSLVKMKAWFSVVELLGSITNLNFHGHSLTPWGEGEVVMKLVSLGKNMSLIGILQNISLEAKLCLDQRLLLLGLESLNLKMKPQAVYQNWVEEKRISYNPATGMVNMDLQFSNGQLLLGGRPMNYYPYAERL